MHVRDGTAVPPGAAQPPESLDLGDAVLRRSRERDAQVLLGATNASFAELYPWMPWAARPLTLDDEIEMLAAAHDDWRNGDAYLYGAYAPDGTALGGFGMHRRVGPGAIEIGYRRTETRPTTPAAPAETGRTQIWTTAHAFR
ncbi:hypothetical protein GCM10022221_78510 [Actinocorallia aurea]